MNGKYIVVDGIDGGGKGSLFESLKEKFLFPSFVFTREPGGTEVGERTREMLLHLPMSPFSEFHFFLAQRKEVRDQVVAPFVSNGGCVISDRSDSSTFAYQIRGRNLPEFEEEFFQKYHRLTPLPTLYIFLDLAPEIAASRLKRREGDGQKGDRFDTENIEFFARVRQGFRDFSEKVETSCVFVDASHSKEQVATEVIAHIQHHLTQS